MNNQERLKNITDEILDVVNKRDNKTYSFNGLKEDPEIAFPIFRSTFVTETESYLINPKNLGAGGEGEGTYITKIYKVTEKLTGEEFYLMWEGKYDSWDGSFWYALGLAEPYTYTVESFRKID